MQHRSSASLLGVAFIAYAFGCLVLALVLIQSPPIVESDPGPLPQIPETKTQLPDMAAISHIPDRKQAFIDLLLPMIDARNTLLLRLRGELEQMQEKLTAGENLTRREAQRLEQLRIRYHVGEDEYPEALEGLAELLLRVDIIPPGMVLAQAAAESGWGTSRFAVDANNLFGQWCFTQGCGLVPARRAAGARHEVQRFDSVEAAVRAYYRNINTHRAYQDLRVRRAALRAAEEPLTGLSLVGELVQYSSRGEEYIHELRTLIRYNDLENAERSEPPQAAVQID